MGLAAPRPPREPLERAFAQRLPARWREAPVPPPLPDEDDEPRSRRGLLLTMVLVAGLAGGAAGALLTVVLLMGNRSGPFQDSWDMLVRAARDSGLAGVAATVTGRSDELDAERASRTGQKTRNTTAAAVMSTHTRSRFPAMTRYDEEQIAERAEMLYRARDEMKH